MTGAGGAMSLKAGNLSGSALQAGASTLAATEIEGALTRLTPEICFNWNYTTCPDPVFSNISAGSTAADGVMADGDTIAGTFFGPNGEAYGSSGVAVGAFTAAGKAIQVDGARVTPDTGGTAAGLDVQMDAVTAANVGLQLIPGAGPVGGSSALTVGTHSGYIDVTFHTPDWSDFDCVTIGWRKVEEFQTALNGIQAAGGTGDVVYTDIVGFGAMTDTDLRIQTDLNGSGTSILTNCGASVPVDNQNMRLRVSVSQAGVVTYAFVVNEAAGEGTLAEPATVTAYTFDDGDVIVPYIASLCVATASDQLMVKSIQVKKAPGTSYAS